MIGEHSMNDENKQEHKPEQAETETVQVDEAANTAAAGASVSNPEDVPVQPAEQAGTSAGAMLRNAREAAGVELSSLALALKISVKKLEALEANRHDELTDSVFVRALASSVCRTLKIDAAPILARLPKSNAPKLVANDETGLNAPFRSPSDTAKRPFWEHLSRPVVLAALAILLGALVLILLPSGKSASSASSNAAPAAAEEKGSEEAAQDASKEPGAEPSPAPAAPAATPAPGTSSLPQTGIPAAPTVTAPKAAPGTAAQPSAPQNTAATAASNTAAFASLSPVATPSIMARSTGTNGATTNLAAVPMRTAPAAAPVPQPAASTTAAASASANANASASASDDEEPRFARSGAVVFRLREPGWVQVTDASGTIRINRVLEAGTPVGVVNGPFPLTVIVGRPEVTDVQVRGRPFDLTPTIQDGQAKFEVQ
jgi:cytoskeleton protein RodZ